MDLDGFVYENELEDIPENPYALNQEADNMMVDVMAQEEEAELDAILSLLDANSSQGPRRPGPPSLSDDEDYDALFSDMLSQQPNEGDGLISSGQMDLS